MKRRSTLWLFNIAMENCPFTDDFPIETSIYNGFSIAMLNSQMETIKNRKVTIPSIWDSWPWSSWKVCRGWMFRHVRVSPTSTGVQRALSGDPEIPEGYAETLDILRPK